MFDDIVINRPRLSSVVRPTLKYHPTYRLESKNPFDARAVEDLLKKIVETEMEIQESVKFDVVKSVELSRRLSDEILLQVKAKDFDRYRIIVTVTAGEKHHQNFRQSAMCLWDADKDALANYVYERPEIFIISTVYGIYYD